MVEKVDEFTEFVEITCLTEVLHSLFTRYKSSGNADIYLIFVPRNKKTYVDNIVRDLIKEAPCGILVLGSKEDDIRTHLTTWDYVPSAYSLYDQAKVIPYTWLI